MGIGDRCYVSLGPVVAEWWTVSVTVFIILIRVTGVVCVYYLELYLVHLSFSCYERSNSETFAKSKLIGITFSTGLLICSS